MNIHLQAPAKRISFFKEKIPEEKLTAPTDHNGETMKYDETYHRMDYVFKNAVSSFEYWLESQAKRVKIGKYFKKETDLWYQNKVIYARKISESTDTQQIMIFKVWDNMSTYQKQFNVKAELYLFRIIDDYSVLNHYEEFDQDNMQHLDTRMFQLGLFEDGWGVYRIDDGFDHYIEEGVDEE